MSAILDQLKRAGAVLVRKRKHDIWRLPNGRTLTVSHSASDQRAERNQLADLRRALKKK